MYNLQLKTGKPRCVGELTQNGSSRPHRSSIGADVDGPLPRAERMWRLFSSLLSCN